MKTPSRYPVLDNRPIDQWKVTELKEELKRRRLATKGLKDDLIKRLDDALRVEGETEEQVDNGNEDPEPNTADEAEQAQVTGVEVGETETVVPVTDEVTVGDKTKGTDVKVGETETGETEAVVPVSVGEDDCDDLKANIVSVEDDMKGNVEQTSQGENVEEKELEPVTDQPPNIISGTKSPSIGVGDKDCEGLPSETIIGDPGLQSDKMERDIEEAGAQQGSHEDIKPSHDVKLNTSDPSSQVSEVSTNLGFPVKSNSFSTDSVSFNEKNELEDNIIADNVKLEPDGKPEMVQPSSSALVPDGGKSHPTDVEEPHENKVSVEEPLENKVSVEEPHENKVSVGKTDNNVTNADMSQKNHSADLCSPEKLNLDRSSVEEPHENKVSVGETDSNVTNADMSQKNHSADLGSPEKLNLDRSSGDDSMEEDALESKQIDSNYHSEEVGERTEKIEISTLKDESPFDVMETDLPAEDKSTSGNNDVVTASSDKRKLPEQELILNNEPSKRQRRWKSESNTAGEPQISSVSPAPTKDVAESAALKRNFSRLDSIGANETPKEREVPPSTKPATNSLRIDRFLRPFTLKAAQELLGKTGTITNFWMDHIKTHCYVSYSSVEEAMETRNAVYNLQWPPNGGRLLVADFVDPEEVKLHIDVPPQPAATPVNTGPPTIAPEPPTMSQPSPRLQNLKQQMSQQQTLPPPPPLSNPALAREWAHPLPPPPPPPPQEKVDAPIVTLDDLFRKTKATPRIYYLPLSEEQVSAVLEERRKNSRK